MEEQEKLLKRYYRGETTVEEERQLKSAYRKGQLTKEPMLAFRGLPAELPAGLTAKIQSDIRKRRSSSYRNLWMISGSIAASLILIVSLRSLIPHPDNSNLQLSDNLKKERFENALRTIGNVLEEKTVPTQKVLYEDNKLIITIE